MPLLDHLDLQNLSDVTVSEHFFQGKNSSNSSSLLALTFSPVQLEPPGPMELLKEQFKLLKIDLENSSNKRKFTLTGTSIYIISQLLITLAALHMVLHLKNFILALPTQNILIYFKFGQMPLTQLNMSRKLSLLLNKIDKKQEKNNSKMQNVS